MAGEVDERQARSDDSKFFLRQRQEHAIRNYRARTCTYRLCCDHQCSPVKAWLEVSPLPVRSYSSFVYLSGSPVSDSGMFTRATTALLWEWSAKYSFVDSNANSLSFWIVVSNPDIVHFHKTEPSANFSKISYSRVICLHNANTSYQFPISESVGHPTFAPKLRRKSAATH